MGNYDDIIHLPHPVSETHLQMSMIDRAAQFSPFAALTGYGDAVKETARLTDRRIVLDEREQDALNERLHIVAQQITQQPEITITYFQPDTKKAGGAYLTVTDRVKKIDDFEQIVCLLNGTKVAMNDIVSIDGKVIQAFFDETE